jgi:hypothetical protein
MFARAVAARFTSLVISTRCLVARLAAWRVAPSISAAATFIIAPTAPLFAAAASAPLGTSLAIALAATPARFLGTLLFAGLVPPLACFALGINVSDARFHLARLRGLRRRLGLWRRLDA